MYLLCYTFYHRRYAFYLEDISTYKKILPYKTLSMWIDAMPAAAHTSGVALFLDCIIFSCV
jgi:hypothetical protein